ncbi:MAG: hypothetical protein OXU66_04180 [Gammaproteobacteria bacterium]|nr:hypothetical protein [Gammaproteobacteria bacterium]MDD9894287.1 hypothetical protein [Gammaproteobacteria bacterium]MDD9958118.1 hypothetical protein [Gammaproteobacteria bacterium]
MLAKLLPGKLSRFFVLPGIVLILLANSTLAQQIAVQEVEIDRATDELSDLISGYKPLPHADIAPLLDTAMVLTSIHNTETWAYCHAKNQLGMIVGRVRVRIPAGGIRFFLSSDIVNERGFVGSVLCTAAGWVVGTELMLGAVTSDIEVQQDTRADVSSMLFPITATK